MDAVTNVGRHEVPVRRVNDPTLWYFSSGEHGRKEAGVYAFWTAVLEKGKLCGRALVTLPPGERFDRVRIEMRTAHLASDREAYARYWNLRLRKGAGIRFIRPASHREVKKWMDAHPKDARFAKPVRIPK